MGACKALAKHYDGEGKPVGIDLEMYLPNYLDWMPIEAKVFWYAARGFGMPDATHVLFVSQGEQRLVTLRQPLRELNLSELKDAENGLEDKIDGYCREHGISRKPRNQ